MGKEKYLKSISSLLSKSPVVSYRSIARTIKNKKTGRYYAKRLIHYLAAKGRLKRLAKGCYTIHEDISLSVFCFQPAYFGLQDALSFHNLWEQETIPVIITTRKVRSGIRKVLGKNVLIRRIKKIYYFGISYHQQEKIALPYSDIEKTFVDMLYFKENLSDEVIKNLRKRTDIKKLNFYLNAYPKKIKKRALALFGRA